MNFLICYEGVCWGSLGKSQGIGLHPITLWPPLPPKSVSPSVRSGRGVHGQNQPIWVLNQDCRCPMGRMSSSLPTPGSQAAFLTPSLDFTMDCQAWCRAGRRQYLHLSEIVHWPQSAFFEYIAMPGAQIPAPLRVFFFSIIVLGLCLMVLVLTNGYLRKSSADRTVKSWAWHLCWLCRIDGEKDQAWTKGQ